MEALLLVVVGLLSIVSIGYTCYRLGKEDGWQEGAAWAIRSDLTELVSNEYRYIGIRPDVRAARRPATREEQ